MNRSRTPLALSFAVVLTACTNDEPPPAQGNRVSAPTADVVRIDPPDSTSGRAIYSHYCADCHDAGEGHPGTMRLSERERAGSPVLLRRTDLTPDYITLIVRNGLGMMPPFRPTEIADSELGALAVYVAGGAME